MPEYEPRYTHGLRARENRLMKNGLLEWEARTIAGAYPTFKRTDYTGHDPAVYISRMQRSRGTTYRNLSRYGYSKSAIEDFILSRYEKNNWLYADGTPNPFKMLEHFRGISIDLGEYIPTAKKRSGKGRSVSKGDVKGQKARARARAKSRRGTLTLRDYDEGRGR